MASYLKPIIDQMQTILRDATNGVNAKKDIIDSTVADIDANAILTFRPVAMPTKFPIVEIFTFGGSRVESEEQNVNMIVEWSITTTVTVVGKNELEASENLDIYMTAITQSIASGVSQNWNLDGKADVVRLLSWEYPSEGVFENVYKEGALLWEVEKEYDPTS